MENMIDIDVLVAKALQFLEKVQALVMQPALWLQFAVIAAVFVVARWVLAPSPG
jgi:hypothetical protein